MLSLMTFWQDKKELMQMTSLQETISWFKSKGGGINLHK